MATLVITFLGVLTSTDRCPGSAQTVSIIESPLKTFNSMGPLTCPTFFTLTVDQPFFE